MCNQPVVNPTESRMFMQADDEMPGEDFLDMLERIGMTEEQYWCYRGWPE